jgi:hypothetical protein
LIAAGKTNKAIATELSLRQALETMVRDRASGNRAATLTNPVNIGIGTK